VQQLFVLLSFIFASVKAYLTGRKVERAEQVQKKNEILNEIIEEASKPVTVDDTVSKLRSGDF